MKVTLSAASLALLKAHTRPGAPLAGARVLSSGRYEVDLDDEVHASLLVIDQDLDRAIAQLCLGAFGRG